MQEDSATVLTSENPDIEDLLMDWKSITHALISVGYGTQLYQELQAAQSCQSDHSIAIQDVSTSKHQSHVPYYHETAKHADNSLLEATNETELTESGYVSDPGGCGSTDESVDDDEACDIPDIPSHLIIDAADLSELRGDGAYPTFEDVFAREESLLSFDYESISSSEQPLIHTYTQTSSPLLHPSSEQEQPLDTVLSANQEHNLSNQMAGDTSQKTHENFQSSEQRCVTDSIKPKQFRISDKKDLLPSDIYLVVQKLVSTAATEYFLNNYMSIYEGWIPSSLNGPLVCNNAAEDPLITAFDMVHNLLEGGKMQRLMLRIALIKLVRVIDAQKATAATDRLLGHTSRGVGQRDSSVAIDTYLLLKGSCPAQALSRTTLHEFCRKGRRWALLGGEAPLSVLVFSSTAETVMYVFYSTISSFRT
ncbi:hypothetical protein ACLOAV_006429 [Pseudogymnoascus australis]